MNTPAPNKSENILEPAERTESTSTAYEKSQMDLNTAIDELRGAFEKPADKPAQQAAPAQSSVPNGILDIPVELQVVLGSVEMLVSDLVNLKENSIVALDRNVSEPVDLVVNGRRIARGELTVQDGTPPRLGIKLLEVSED